MPNPLTEAKSRFIDSWGQMGSQWGINRTMAQIHALLMISDKPLCTDEVMKELRISRGNANMNLRSLVDWGLVRRVSVKNDRKEYFQSEKDVWKMFCTIARERKKREMEPVLGTLQECLDLVKGAKDSNTFRDKVQELYEFVKTVDFALAQIAGQEKNVLLPRLLKLFAKGGNAK